MECGIFIGRALWKDNPWADRDMRIISDNAADLFRSLRYGRWTSAARFGSPDRTIFGTFA